MNPLESLLREVEPIFQGSHFTHPSFQEVLTARQFAEEINSGRLNVKDAYTNFWSKKEPTLSKRLSHEFRMVSYAWRSVLNHLSGMLSENSTLEFLRVISECSLKYKKDLDFCAKGGYIDRILEDFTLCAQCIGLHQELDLTKKPAYSAIEFLMSFIKAPRREYDTPLRFDFRIDKAVSALIQTKSTFVAENLVAYIKFCEESSNGEESSDNTGDDEGDFGYSFFNFQDIYEEDCKDKQRENLAKSEGIAKKCLRAMSEGGTKIPAYVPEDPLMVSQDDMWFVGKFGDAHCLDTLLIWMSNEVLFPVTGNKPLTEEYCNYFGAVFEILRRHDFRPELMRQFNDKFSKTKNHHFTEAYHICLKELAAKMSNPHDIDLYEHLEVKGVQFLDSWVYKPK